MKVEINKEAYSKFSKAELIDALCEVNKYVQELETKNLQVEILKADYARVETLYKLAQVLEAYNDIGGDEIIKRLYLDKMPAPEPTEDNLIQVDFNKT